MKMKYEICKVKILDSKKIYQTVAWTDNRVYADMIKRDMCALEDDEYVVLKDGQEFQL